MSDVLSLEFSATLALAHLSPYSVEEVVAGWESDGGVDVTSGFVVRLSGGGFAYITSQRDEKRSYVSSSTQIFSKEPKHLYRRGVEWSFDREALNGHTQIAKQEANYPGTRVASGVAAGGMVRLPSLRA